MSNMRPLIIRGYATLVVSDTPIGLSSADPPLVNGIMNGKQVRRMFVTCEDDNVRWRGDGTAPTMTEGHILAEGDSISFTGANYEQLLNIIQFIKVTTDATLRITFFE